ncbi:helix-turn-helix domain-containing protein [Stratiformator vulcanicus]|uniref:helix-turn-helix domain-containing protein n=1 Tax=Stratiformator vulcanicus TaxID=2527980 RepID=UPI002877CF2E|nr:helix-turn-helix domain-containing protein [Stratiformator vulcanicus]
MSDDQEPPLLTLKQASQRFGISVSTLRRWARRGEIAYLQAGRGGTIRIPADALEDLMNRPTPRSPAPHPTEPRAGGIPDWMRR